MKRRIYEILNNPREDDRLGRAVNFALMTLIAANVAASILETDATIRAHLAPFLRVFEGVSLAVFTVEYLLRLWSCTADPRYAGALGRVRWAVTPMAIIDFIAIGPSYIDVILPGTLDLRFLRVLRLMRLFRLFHVGPLRIAFNTLVRVIQSRRIELGVTLGFVTVATVIAAGAIYLLEHDEPNTVFTSIPRAMWWSVVTITTVGYGDMVPQTVLGQVIGAFVAFVGICALALPVGILSSGFIEEMARQKAEAAEEVAAAAATTAPPSAPIPAATKRACPHCGGALEDDAHRS